MDSSQKIIIILLKNYYFKPRLRDNRNIIQFWMRVTSVEKVWQNQRIKNIPTQILFILLLLRIFLFLYLPKNLNHLIIFCQNKDFERIDTIRIDISYSSQPLC